MPWLVAQQAGKANSIGAWPTWCTTMLSALVPNALQGEPPEPGAAAIVFAQSSAAGVKADVCHEPPRLGRVASNVPTWLFGELDLTAFQNTARPAEVAVASGPDAEKMWASMVTGRPAAPLALIGVTSMRNVPVAPDVHSTCSTPSLPRASPTSSMLVSLPVTRVHWPGRGAFAGFASATWAGAAAAATHSPQASSTGRRRHVCMSPPTV